MKKVENYSNQFNWRCSQRIEYLFFHFLNLEDISRADIYLNFPNFLGVLKLDSAALLSLKESLCLKLDDDSFFILPQITSSFSSLIELLTNQKDDLPRAVR